MARSSGVHYRLPEVLGNVSFPALSATPVWRRMINGKKVAIALPVEGKRQPLVYAGKQARPLSWLCLPACLRRCRLTQTLPCLRRR